MKLGILQGRLSPPVHGAIQGFPAATWANEFPKVRQADLTGLDWNWTGHLGDPVTQGRAWLARSLADQHRVRIGAVVMDYLLEHPLIRAAGVHPLVFERVKWLLRQARILGAEHVVLPFVGRIAGTGGEIEETAAWREGSRLGKVEGGLVALVGVLQDLQPTIDDTGVGVHLETDLDPALVVSVLRELHDTRIRVTYDTGDAAALGHDPTQELAILDPFLGSVHLKDRLADQGMTVPLGHGAVDFPRVFSHLVGFDGPFTLQVARGATGKEVAWAIHHRKQVEVWRASSR